MASAQDIYRIAQNIVARRGIENVDLHAELARAINFADGLENMPIEPPAASSETITAPISDQMTPNTTQGEIMPENGSETAQMGQEMPV